MKNTAVLLALCLSLLMSIIGIHVVNVPAVNGVAPHLFPEPLIISMGTLNSSKMYTPNSDIVLKLNVSKDIGAASFDDLYPSTGWFCYSLDDTPKITGYPRIVSRTISEVTSHHGGPTQIETTQYSVAINLRGLSGGEHKISVYLGVGFFYRKMSGYGGTQENVLQGSDSRTFGPLYFNVDDGYYPSIRITLPENIIYDTCDVPLTFAVSELVSQISYSLDGCDNVTIVGNTTLTELPNGGHNVIVYAKDRAGNIGVSRTVFFNVVKPEPLELFPATIVVASIAAIAIIGAGILAHFKKIKKKLYIQR